MFIVDTTPLVLRKEASKTRFVMDFGVGCNIRLDRCGELGDRAHGLETERTGEDDEVILELVG